MKINEVLEGAWWSGPGYGDEETYPDYARDKRGRAMSDDEQEYEDEKRNMQLVRKGFVATPSLEQDSGVLPGGQEYNYVFTARATKEDDIQEMVNEFNDSYPEFTVLDAIKSRSGGIITMTLFLSGTPSSGE